MRIAFLGATKFSESILLHLLENKIDVGMIFSIPQSFGISYSKEKVVNYNFADISLIAEKYNIPHYSVETVEGNKMQDYLQILESFKPDVILVMGWYYMVPKKIRDLSRLGAWGIHASLLPDYAGGAPLVWAIIEGCEKTGITLFKLDEGVDDGDIIAQAEICIEPTDTIKEVYEDVIEKSKKILLDTLTNIQQIKFIPQDKSLIKVYPQRKPEDGEIDLSLPAKKMFDFIRAQAPPYPGAFIKTSDGKKIIIEKARLA